MPKSFSDFVKDGLGMYGGKAGAAFAVLDAKSILDSDNKLKALLKTLRDVILFKPLIAVGLAGAFGAVSKAIKSVIADTGSLDAALRKLSQIRGLQQSLAPFVGGLAEAKRRVAELVNLSARYPMFGFESFGRAAKTLEVFTRGAMSSVSAVKAVADVAADTNNTLEETSDILGEFYDRLRNGEDITSTSERLRQMGVITQAQANNFDKMAASGADATSVINALNAAVAQHAGGLDRAASSGNPEIAAQAHQAAAANLQASVGSPWSKDDVQNTQNATAALNSIAPALGRVSQFAHDATGGFTTLWSSIGKYLAGSPILLAAFEGLSKSGLALIGIVSQLAKAWLAFYILKNVPGMITGITGNLYKLAGASKVASTAVTAFGASALGLTAATGIGLLVSILVTVGAAIYNFTESAKQSSKALRELKEAHAAANREILAQIGAIETLADKHEALSAAVEANTKAYQEYLDVLASDKSNQEKQEARKNVYRAKAAIKLAASAPVEDEAGKAQARIDAEREERYRAASYQSRLALASPEERIRLQKREAARAGALASQGRSEITGRAATEQARGQQAADNAEMEAALKDSQMRVADFNKRGLGRTPDAARERANLETTQRAVDQSRGESLAIGSQSKSKAVREETAVQQINAAIAASQYADKLLELKQDKNAPNADIKATEGEIFRQRALAGSYVINTPEDKKRALEERQRHEIEAERARIIERNAAPNEDASNQAELQAKVEERQLAISILRVDAEKEISSLKSIGVQRAADEYRIRQKQIDDEIELLKKQGESPQGEKIKALQAQKESGRREESERSRGVRVEKLGVERELEIGRLKQTGHSQEAVQLGDVSDFSERYEKLRTLYGEDGAQKLATQGTQQDIFSQVQQQVNSVPQVADSLQRVGGGGGVYAPGDAVAEYTKRSALSLKNIEALLKQERDPGGVK